MLFANLIISSSPKYTHCVSNTLALHILCTFLYASIARRSQRGFHHTVSHVNIYLIYMYRIVVHILAHPSRVSCVCEEPFQLA